ncbi:MAG: hypothetical protein Q9220_006801 [cf. Caloplaca sp. 1 TL-2023]
MSRAQYGESPADISNGLHEGDSAASTFASDKAFFSCHPIRSIKRVKLPCRDPDSKWDISIEDSRVASIEPHEPLIGETAPDPCVLNGHGAFLAPSLCHPHIHLDKCFLMSDPKYADLSIEKGDFAEALSLTSRAKSRFSHDDLLRRGRWLIEESIAAGVTCMRAFVEVDTTVRFKCLDAALLLKKQYQDACEVQVCAFAQDPVFSGENAAEGRNLMEEALRREGVDVIGSTPYVEADESRTRKNIEWAIEIATRYDKHLDLHLDYNLDSTRQPLVFHVIEVLRQVDWTSRTGNKTVVLGHCTRLTLFTDAEWFSLRRQMGDLPISLVGLPTSDLFMMDKPSVEEGGGQRVRGTLRIPQMIQKYGFDGAIGVNNIGNAFTPHGSCDPLSVASMCVGIYQTGTKHEADIMYECVSARAKVAIGCGRYPTADIQEGVEADFALYDNPGRKGTRGRRTLQELVYDPPRTRRTLRHGHLIDVDAGQ